MKLFMRRSIVLFLSVIVNYIILFHREPTYGEIFNENLPCDCPNIWDNLCQGQVTFSADWLFMKATQDGLGFVDVADFVENVGSEEPIDQQTLFIDLKSAKPHFHWDDGFRLGAAYHFPCHKWGLGVNWTQFTTSAKNNKTGFFTATLSEDGFETISGDVLIATWNAFPSPSGFFLNSYAPNSISAHWKLHLRLVDLELTRDYRPCACLVITPTAGVRIAQINQNLETFSFADRKPEIPQTINHYTNSNRMRNNFFAAGLKTGLTVEYEIGWGWSLFGSGSVSIVWGSFDIRQVNQVNISSLGDGVFNVQNKLVVKDNFRACRAITDARVGLQWRHCFEEGFAITLKVAYENHLFFGQNMLQKYSSFGATDVSFDGFQPYSPFAIGNQSAAISRPTKIHGNLGLQGVTVNGRIDF